MIQNFNEYEKSDTLSTLEFALERMLKESHGERADHEFISGHNKLIHELQMTDKNSIDVTTEKDLTIDKLKELVIKDRDNLKYIIMYWNQLSVLQHENFELFTEDDKRLNRMFGKATIIIKG